MSLLSLRRGAAALTSRFVGCGAVMMASRAASVATFAGSSSSDRFDSLLSSPSSTSSGIAARKSAAEVRASADLWRAVDPLAFNVPIISPPSSSVVTTVEEIRVPEAAENNETLELMNRNVRDPKPANHGKRPCSNRRRKRAARQRAGDHWGLPTKIPKGCDH